MNKSLMFYLFVLLLASQSVAASIDAHRAHQPEPVQRYSSNILTVHSQRPVSSAYDCHHCCHCHGLSHLYIESKSTSHDLLESLKPRVGYQYFYASIVVAPDNPPPII